MPPYLVVVILYVVVTAILRTVRDIHRQTLTAVRQSRRRHKRSSPMHSTGVAAADEDPTSMPPLEVGSSFMPEAEDSED